jgi:hypothetical protein
MSAFSCKLFGFLFRNLAFGAGSVYLGSGIKKYAVICYIPFMYFLDHYQELEFRVLECYVSFLIFILVSKTVSCSGRLSGCSLLHGVQGAHPARADQAGGDRPHTWRFRGRRHCRCSDCQVVSASYSLFPFHATVA